MNKTRSIKFDKTTFNANTIVRKFVNVPLGATWATVEMQTSDATKLNEPAKFYIHTLQLLPQKYCKDTETQKLYAVSSENPTLHNFRCEVSRSNCFNVNRNWEKIAWLFAFVFYYISCGEQGDNVLEVCIARYWSNVGETELNFKIDFHGIKSNRARKSKAFSFYL